MSLTYFKASKRFKVYMDTYYLRGGDVLGGVKEVIENLN